jgi:hypothetical protein
MELSRAIAGAAARRRAGEEWDNTGKANGQDK